MWVHSSGGLVYHWRAVRYRDRIWAPFQRALEEWLGAWQPGTQELVIVGPSAGHTLPWGFFRRFRRVHLIEPDPLARWIFLRRLAQLGNSAPKPLVDMRNYFSPGGPRLLFEGYRDHAILFANVLGQLGSITREDSAVRSELALELARSRASWASFHDRVSGGLAPRLGRLETLPSRLSDAELLSKYYPKGPGAELLDHSTEGIFGSDRPHSYLPWQLFPGQHHLIEGVHR